MRTCSLSAALRFAVAAACCLAVVKSAFAQGKTGSILTETGVVLTKLSPPVYPPLARQATISGDVHVRLSIQKDGTVVAADAVSGHPLLEQAALDSARNSTFECRGCSNAVTMYSMTYTFDAGQNLGVCDEAAMRQQAKSELTQAQGHVTLAVGGSCIICAYSATIGRKTRSARCLYLWKCGLREAAGN